MPLIDKLFACKLTNLRPDLYPLLIDGLYEINEFIYFFDVGGKCLVSSCSFVIDASTTATGLRKHLHKSHRKLFIVENFKKYSIGDQSHLRYNSGRQVRARCLRKINITQPSNACRINEVRPSSADRLTDDSVAQIDERAHYSSQTNVHDTQRNANETTIEDEAKQIKARDLIETESLNESDSTGACVAAGKSERIKKFEFYSSTCPPLYDFNTLKSEEIELMESKCELIDLTEESFDDKNSQTGVKSIECPKAYLDSLSTPNLNLKFEFEYRELIKTRIDCFNELNRVFPLEIRDKLTDDCGENLATGDRRTGDESHKHLKYLSDYEDLLHKASIRKKVNRDQWKNA